TVSELVLEVGQWRTLDLSLELAGITSTVNVQAEDEEAPAERSSPEISRVVRGQELRQLPVNGRQWASLMELAPGAVNSGSGTPTSIRFFGHSVEDNNWTLDGVDATGVLTATQDSSVRLVVSLESLAEFRVSSALYAADAGVGSGAQVQLLTRAGANRTSGTAYDYLRQSALNARPYGSQGDAPVFMMNQFGANLGGPLPMRNAF